MPINAQLAVEQEATPGTAETLVLADVPARIVRTFDVSPDLEEIDVDEVQESSSKRPLIYGRKMITFGVSFRLRGPPDQATVPAVSDLLQSAMFREYVANTLPIGAITGGPFKTGEIVTGGTSAATGMVLQETATGASVLPVIVLSGTFDVTSETITGDETAASATETGGVSAAGRAYRPFDSDFGAGDTLHHITAKLIRNGRHLTARGALSTYRFPFRNGHPCIPEFAITGAFAEDGDDALFAINTYPEEAVAAPQFLNVGLKIGSYSPLSIIDVVLDSNTEIVPLEDANDASADGVLYADYRRSRPSLTLMPKQVAKSDYDFFGNWQNEVTQNVEWTLGTVTGSTWVFSCREAQFSSVGFGEENERPKFPVTMVLNGNNNNELLIWVK